MEILERLTEEGARRRLSFVLVGGHALIAWGVSRQTGDLDLLIPERWRLRWKEVLADLGYGTPYEHTSFVQYAAPSHGAWPVDLLVVGDDTFDRVAAESVGAQFGRVECRVACPDHLLAMKFHALRYVTEAVGLKYLADVHALLRRTGRKVADDAVRDLCLKYGSAEVYERLVGTRKAE